MSLTDAQCDVFRRLPVGFNDMVRAIYRAGFEAGLKAPTEMSMSTGATIFIPGKPRKKAKR